MGPIFNKKIVKKCNLWDREQYTNILFTMTKSTIAAEPKKKKKKKKEKNAVIKRRNNCNPNSHIAEDYSSIRRSEISL